MNVQKPALEQRMHSNSNSTQGHVSWWVSVFAVVVSGLITGSVLQLVYKNAYAQRVLYGEHTRVLFLGTSHFATIPNEWLPRDWRRVSHGGLDYSVARSICNKFTPHCESLSLVVLECDPVPLMFDTIDYYRPTALGEQCGFYPCDYPKPLHQRLYRSLTGEGFWKSPPGLSVSGIRQMDSEDSRFPSVNAALNNIQTNKELADVAPEDPRERAERFSEHLNWRLTHFQRYYDKAGANEDAVLDLAASLRQRNIQVVFVEPPYHEHYFDQLPPDAVRRYALFKRRLRDNGYHIQSMQDEGVVLPDSCFNDFDHVNRKGASKLVEWLLSSSLSSLSQP